LPANLQIIFDMAKKVIVLVRVSTALQDLEAQKKEVIANAIADGYKLSEIEVVEGKESAIKLAEEQRETLQEMKLLISANPSIEAVYCFAVDRLARRVSVVLSIKDYLTSKGVNLVFLNPHKMGTLRRNEKGVLVEDELTSMLLMFLAYGAEMEMKVKKARFQSAKALLKQEGKVDVSKVMFGYYKAKDKTIKIKEEEAEIIRKLYEDYTTKPISLQTLYNDFVNKGYLKQIKGGSARVARYLSELAYSGRRTDRKYPAIVTEEQQDKAIEKMKKGKSLSKNVDKNVYLAKGLIYDSVTNCTMNGSGNRGVYRTHNGKLEVVNLNAVDSIVWDVAIKLKALQLANLQISNKEQYEQQIVELDKQLENINEILEDNQAKQKKALKQLLDGKVAENIYNEVAEDLTTRQKEYGKRKLQITNEMAKLKRLSEIEDASTIAQREENIADVTDDIVRREIINEVIDKAVMERVNGNEKILTIYPKHQYKIKTALPRYYRIKRSQRCVKIYEAWLQNGMVALEGDKPKGISKIVEIPFSGKFLERYKKDNQGNYKYMKED
jgi:DNA invertase Pin-like site-specific DNA recombinase